MTLAQMLLQQLTKTLEQKPDVKLEVRNKNYSYQIESILYDPERNSIVIEVEPNV